MGMKTLKKNILRNNLGLTILTLLGLALVIVCLIPVSNIDTVINTSLIVDPAMQDDPYKSGTVYHTHVLCKSILSGDINVEEEGIYLTVNGFNTQHLKQIFIKGRHEFVIDPADDLYIFVFDNTGGQNQSLIEFKLKERWTIPLGFSSPILFITGLIGFSLLLIGLSYFFLVAVVKKGTKKY